MVEELFHFNSSDEQNWPKLPSHKMPMAGRNSLPKGSARTIAKNTESRHASCAFITFSDPLGTWDGGREKVPAAICRKVAVGAVSGNPEIEIWGDGEQTRSCCYIDGCVNGIYKLMQSDYAEPLNLGQDRLISINQLADMVAAIAGVKIIKKQVVGPQGVRGQNSDNTRLREVLR